MWVLGILSLIVPILIRLTSAEMRDFTRCPLDLQALKPCACASPATGNFTGLLIRCTNVNLPQLAKRLRLLSGYTLAKFEVDGGLVRKWDRDLLGNVTILQVVIRNVGLELIEEKAMGTSPLTTVTGFSVPNNNLVEVPGIVSQLTSLRILDLSFNRLKSFPASVLRGLPLEEINLAGNQLIEMSPKAFAALPQLVSLNLGFNKLTSVPDLGIPLNHALKTLNMSGNLIRSVGPSELHNLSYVTVLDLSHNQLDTMHDDAIRGMSRLLILYLDHNNLVEIPQGLFAMGMTIRNLSLSYNRLEKLSPEAISPLYYIEEINLDHNNFRSIPPNFISNKFHLDKLNMSWNPIERIEDKALTGLKNMTMLDLSHCKLSYFGQMAIGDLERLGTLLLGYNEITGIGADSLGFLPSVQYLDLSNNKISSLRGLQIAKFIGVMTLDMSRNFIHSIKSIDVPKLAMLMHLDLSFNGLSQLAPGCLKDFLSLMTLKLNDNSLKNIDAGTFGNMYSLLELDLSNNNITSFQRFALRGLRALRTVRLDNNFINEFFQITTTLDTISARNNSIPQIKRASFPRANALSVLDLSFNNISSIESEAFKYLYILSTLNLRGNRLTEIPKAELKDHVTMKSLDLGQNLITTVDYDAFSGLRLRSLSLDHNKITSFNETALRGLSEVTELHIGGNQLLQLEPTLLKGLSAVNFLDVGGNLFTDIPTEAFEDLYSLQKIDLSKNKLATIPRRIFGKNAYLTEVDFSGNQIRTIPTHIEENPGHLKVLNFSNNLVVEVLGTPNLPYVEKLDLSYNAFQKLSLSALTKLTSLKELRLSDNPMEILSDGSLTSNLDYVSLDRTMLHSVPFSILLALTQDNSTLSFDNVTIQCDCRAVGLQEYLRLKQNTSNNFCSLPASLQGVPIVNATLEGDCQKNRQAAKKLLEEKQLIDLQAARSGDAIMLSWEPKGPVDVWSFSVSVVYENKSIQAPKMHIPYYVDTYAVDDLSFSKNYRACVQPYDRAGAPVGSTVCKLVRLGSMEQVSGAVSAKLTDRNSAVIFVLFALVWSLMQ